MPNKLTGHRAASQERQAWMRKVKRMLDQYNGDIYLGELYDWGKDRVRRFKIKKGGL